MGFILLILCLGYARACPTLRDLEDQNSVPDAVKQIRSDRVLIDWSELWSNFDFECFSKVSVLLGEDEVAVVEDVEKKNASVEVTPCQEARFRIKVILSESGESFHSHRTEADFMTYEAPKAKAHPHVEVDYAERDFTRLRVKSKFTDLVENPACRKVTATELRFRQMGHDDNLWTVVKSAGGVFRSLDEVVQGLNNVCAEYEVVLQLIGTPGTEASPSFLARLPPVNKVTLKSSYDAGFKYK